MTKEIETRSIRIKKLYQNGVTLYRASEQSQRAEPARRASQQRHSAKPASRAGQQNQSAQQPLQQRCCVVSPRYQENRTRSSRMRDIVADIVKEYNKIVDSLKQYGNDIIDPFVKSYNTFIVTVSQYLGEYVKWPPMTDTSKAYAFRNTIIDNFDYTRFSTITHLGIQKKNMYEGKIGDYSDYECNCFSATFSRGRADPMIIAVNTTVDYSTALAWATRYAKSFGGMPKALLDPIKEVWVHLDGYDTYLAVGGNIVIYVQNSINDDREGRLEEILLHEAAHTGIDKYTTDEYPTWRDKWRDAQVNDKRFISEYAAKNFMREDVAESFLVYYALKYRYYRMGGYDPTTGTTSTPDQIASVIRNAIPNRIKFFDDLVLEEIRIENMYE